MNRYLVIIKLYILDDINDYQLKTYECSHILELMKLISYDFFDTKYDILQITLIS